MVSHLFFYQLMVLGLLWLCVMLHYAWPNACTGGALKPSKPLPPPCKRSSDPKPFPGLTRKPCCAACEQAAPEPAATPPPATLPAPPNPFPAPPRKPSLAACEQAAQDPAAAPPPAPPPPITSSRGR